MTAKKDKPHGHAVPNAWPFPTKDNPLKPWTPKEVKAYEQLQRAKVVEQLRKAPDAPM